MVHCRTGFRRGASSLKFQESPRETLNPFRRRADDADGSAADVTLGALLSMGKADDQTGKAVEQAQLQSLIRLVPMTITLQLLAAGILCIALRHQVAAVELATWFSCSLAICVTRGARAWRLRSNANYARRKPANVDSITIVIACLATLWVVPPLHWFGQVDISLKLVICLLCVGLMSAGCITLSNVPPAAITYVSILTIGTSAAAVQLHSLAQLLLTWVYALVLCYAVMASTRQFVFNVRARLELQEQGELIALLREFEASGSDWLWELDARQRIVHVSQAMAEALGRPRGELVGARALEVLDPGGRATRLSAGLRNLFNHARQGTPFRDIAIPMFNGRRWWTLSGKTLIDSQGKLIGWRGVGSDITDVRLSGSDVVRAARRDPLTGIANRLLVREHLEESLLRRASDGAGCALLLVDLDRFKLVNDTLGHGVGDQLLCEVARRLDALAGDEACVGRLGGDEFAVIWTGASDREALAALAERLRSEIARTVTIGSASLHVGSTIGISIGGVDGATEGELMRSADLALYSAKNAGRGGCAFFQPDMRERAEDLRLLENDLRNALGSDGFSLVFQPIVDAGSGDIVAREALLRWTHPERGEVSPEVFVPIIEDTGLIHQIGAWVLREACAEAAGWPEDIALSVNISATQLNVAGLPNTVLNVLASTGLHPSRLQLEVTEGIFIGDDPTTLSALESLRRIGVCLVLDDFGRGYCSFGYLRRARFSKLKVDQSFVRAAAAGDADCYAIVEAIIALARSLGIRTTAEGVEGEIEAELMRKLGCDELQGFLFGRPMSRPRVPVESDDEAARVRV